MSTLGSTITVEALDHDPYPLYERLRDAEPVSWVESVGLWLVTRWEDVRTVDLSPDIFSAETEPSTLRRTFGPNLLASEGAYHDKVRAVIEPAFHARKVRNNYVEQIIRPLAEELVDGFAARGEAEIMADFAEPLSVRTLQQVTGLGDVDVATLHRWFESLALGASNFEGDPDKQAVADAASAEVDAAVAAILERVTANPDDSILSAMVHTDHEGQRLAADEIASNLKVMIVGGMQEPGDAIGICLWALLSHPDQARQVMDDPALIRQATEEALRWHSPVGTSTRQTLVDTELAGVKLEKGSLVAAVLSSANRDERHWSDPARFDIHRDEGGHVAFALGKHFCVGSQLARQEIRVAFEVLFDRLPNLRLATDDIDLHGWEFRRPVELRVTWDV